jgi:thioredoxin reductase
MKLKEYDCIIIGGGPAGLGGALALGRCRRSVLICDAGHPRNERSKAMHGFLSRDGMSPKEFLDTCRNELRAYPNVQQISLEAAHVRSFQPGFAVEFQNGVLEHSRTLLLATGVIAELPAIDGFERFYGRSAHQCPYCDGWEHCGKALAVLGDKSEAAELAIEMLIWGRNIILCTNGEAR